MCTAGLTYHAWADVCTRGHYSGRAMYVPSDWLEQRAALRSTVKLWSLELPLSANRAELSGVRVSALRDGGYSAGRLVKVPLPWTDSIRPRSRSTSIARRIVP